MRRSRKIILITVLALAVLAGSIGGVVYAQTGSGDNSQVNTLLDRVAGILTAKGVNVTSQQLNDAFTQAQQEMRDETQDKYLQGLVDQNKITQEQADQYKAWLKNKPDVPLAPGFGGGMMKRGFGGLFGGPRGWCAPQPAPQVTPQTTQ